MLMNAVRAVADATETPPELGVGAAIPTLSAAIGKKAVVKVADGYFEPLNSWFLTALGPGNRKTARCMAKTLPLRAWEKSRQSRRGAHPVG